MSAIPRFLKGKPGRGAVSAVFGSRRYASDNGFVKCAYPDIDIPQVHVTEFVLGTMGKWHDKVALECGITGKKLTYGDLRTKSLNFGRALRKKLKLERGDTVALLLPNIPEFPVCVLGTFAAGLKVTTVNPAYTSEEIKRQLLDADAKILITINEAWAKAKAAVTQMQAILPVLIIKTKASESIPEGAFNFQEFVDETINIPDVHLDDLNDTVFLPYSSGTTGKPKGVRISSQNLVSNIFQAHSPVYKVSQDATATHQDIIPAVLPFFHVYGFSAILLSALKSGVKLVTLPKFSTDTYLKTLIEHKPNVFMIVPPIVIFLNTHPEVKSEYLQNMRTLTSGAAPLGALDEEKLRQKVGKPFSIIQGYGLTEATSTVMITPYDKQGKHPGSMGHPLQNTLLKVIDFNDSEGKHLGPNMTGELLVKGPQIMQGYHKRPEETKNSFLDGWLRTGDLVYYDQDGMFYVADRIKELIKVKGFQVAPAELEEIIRDFPGVADAAVIGIPHQFSGEVPRAYVVPKRNVTLEVDKLKEFVQSKVASHKKLAGGVAVVDTIPKNASGKVLRRELKFAYQEKGI